MTNDPMDRRRVLSMLGAGVGAAVLGACAKDTAATRTTATTVTSTGASTTAVPGGKVTAAMFGGAAACVATPEQTDGPYYIDVDKIRGDIREDRQGVPLRVAARVVDTDGCTPIKDAVFEIWHCDADGIYSGFEAQSTGRSGGRGVSDETRYLRGAQVTDADGIAEILTIYPGWYSGRAVHIHAKVLLSNRALLTTQLYFDEAVTRQVFMREPYRANGPPDRTNKADGFFQQQTALSLTDDGEGYLGLITIAVG